MDEKQSAASEKFVNIENSKLDQSQMEQVYKMVNVDFRDLFIGKKGHGKANSVEHRIITGGEKTVNLAPYRASFKEREIIREQITVMLLDGVIRPSTSPWASRVVLVKKKNGKNRFCIDFRGLNAVTKRDVYPLPRIDDSLAALQRGKFFTSLDMSAGYWQIAMAKDSIEKTAFVTDSGLYEFLVMPFGLCNAPATFQRYMDAVLAGLKWNCLLVYIDDIIIFSPTFEEHLRDLREVFIPLRGANLSLNPEKCFICKEKLSYLGHVVSAEGIEADPIKIKAILEMREPENAEDVRTLLGGCGYYRKFIPKYAELCGPLYKVTQLGIEFKWDKLEAGVLKELKRLLASTPILKHPNFNYPFQVHTDASGEGLGATLNQTIDGEERVILYLSRTLQPAEKKWVTRELEALAIVWALETLRPYLIGYKFMVVTDHDSLKWLMTAQKPARLVRWAVRLSEFDFDIVHRPGKEHGDADFLSRLGARKLVEAVNETVGANLTYDYISGINGVIQLVDISEAKLIESQRRDFTLSEVIRVCENNGGISPSGPVKLVNQLLYKVKGTAHLLMVPHDVRDLIMEQYHDHDISAHMARDRIGELLKDRFFWNGMDEYIGNYVKHCELCQKIKTRANVTAGLLMPRSVSRPFEMVGTDIAIMRTSTGGYRYILVCIDYFTNWVEAAAMKRMTAEEVVRTFFKIIISRHGCPDQVVSDSGTQFMSQAMAQLCTSFKIKKVESTPYHQQANGKVEKFIGFLKQALALVTARDKLEKWDQMIDHCLFVYRTTVSRVLGDNPFFMIYGRDATLPQDLALCVSKQGKRETKADHLNYQLRLHKTLKEAYGKLMARKIEEQNKYKTYYDKTHRMVEFKIGDKVLILFDTPTKGPLMPRWEGPFLVKDKWDEVIYRVENEDKLISVHVRRMKPFYERN